MRKVLILVACLGLGVGSSARAEPPDAKTSARTDAYGDPLPPGAIARLGTIRLRHGGQIGSVAFSPDGRTLASSAADHLIKFWDPDTGQEKATLRGHTHTVWSIAFSPDGKTLASGSADQTIKLWDLTGWQSGRLITPILTLKGHTEPIRCVAFSPDGKMLASACEDATVKLWDLSGLRGGMLSRRGNAAPNQTNVSGRESMARPEVPAFTFKGHGARVFSVAFSPDGKTLASASDDKTVKLWDLAGRRLLASLQHDGPAMAVAYSPDRKTLATGARNGVLRLWNWSQGNAKGAESPVLTIEAHDNWIECLAFSGDSKTLASASWDGTVKLWDFNKWQHGNGVLPVRTLGRHFTVNTVMFSPDGKTIASGGGDNVVKLWDVGTGKAKIVPKAQREEGIKPEVDEIEAHEGEVRAVAFSPDGRTIATGGNTDRTIRLWHLTERKSDKLTPPVLGLTRPTERVFCLAFSPDGRSLASCGAGGTLTIWAIPSGKESATIQAPVKRLALWSLAFHPNGQMLASTTLDGPIRLYDLKSKRVMNTLNSPTWFSSVAFSPDGRRIAASGGEGTVKLWDATTGREWASLAHGDEWIRSVAFSPDGKSLAAGNEADEVILWDLVTAQFIGVLHGHRDTVRSVAFSPDDKTLASAGDDGLVKLWNLTKIRMGTFSRQEKTNLNVWFRNSPQSIAHAKLVHDFAGHLADVTGVAFSPNGTILASSSRDTTALLWDVANLPPKQNKEAPALGSDAIISCWNDLAGENAAKAYEAIWTLAALPDKAVPFIRNHLRPAPTPDAKRLAQLIDELDNNDFLARTNASDELEKLQDLAEPILRERLAKPMSLEVRRRVEQLLEKIDAPVTDPEQLRQLRAIEVLEHIGSPESREVLQRLTKGAPEARLTQEAMASLKRLEKAGR